MNNRVCLQDMVSSDEEVDAAQAAKEEQWEDPICRLFQKPHVSEIHTLTRLEGGSSMAAGDSVQGKMKEMATVEAEAAARDSVQAKVNQMVAVEAEPAARDSIQAKVNQKVTLDAEAGCSYQFPMEKPIKKEMEPAVPAAPVTPPTSPTPPAAPPARPTPPLSPAQRQASFLDMGFAFDLVDRAFKQHGEGFTLPYVKVSV